VVRGGGKVGSGLEGKVVQGEGKVERGKWVGGKGGKGWKESGKGFEGTFMFILYCKGF
jgi:hypothetical protein